MNIFKILFPHYKKNLKNSQEGIKNAKSSKEKAQYKAMNKEDQKRMKQLKKAQQGKVN